MLAVPFWFLVTLYSSSLSPVAPEFVGSGTETIQPVDDGSACWAGSGVEESVTPSSFRSAVCFPSLNEPADGHLLIAFLPVGLVIQPTSDSRNVTRFG